MTADPFALGDEAQESAFGAPDGSFLPAEQSAGGFGFDEATLGQAPTIYGDGPPVQQEPPPQAAAPRRPIRGDDLSPWERRRRVRLQARKVRRIIRHIEPFSVLKVSLIFYLCLWVILVLAGVLLWSVAVSSGSVESVEEIVRDLFAAPEFSFNAGTIFRVYAIVGFILGIAGTAFNALLCVLFNLISDLVGGIRMTVIEEESARFRPPRRRTRR